MESARVAPSRPVREAPYRSKTEDKFARLDKSHIVQHKTGRWEKATGGLAAGNPARPRCHRFMMHNVFLSYGRGSTGRAVAPPSAPTPQIGKDGRAKRKSGRFAGEHDAGAGAPLGNRGGRRGQFECYFPRPTSWVIPEKTASKVASLKRQRSQ